MATKCAHCPLRRSNLFVPHSDDDTKFMQRFKVGELVIEPGTPMLIEGSNSPQLFTALRGMGPEKVLVLSAIVYRRAGIPSDGAAGHSSAKPRELFIL